MKQLTNMILGETSIHPVSIFINLFSLLPNNYFLLQLLLLSLVLLALLLFSLCHGFSICNFISGRVW